MKKLLHIIATPRGSDSRTLKVSAAFLAAFKSSHKDWVVEELDLFQETLPPLTVRRVDGKYLLLGGKDLFGEVKEAWNELIAHIERFMSADGYLLSTPMWNFGVPYVLKQYLDIIVQPRYLFRYTETGPEGLVKGKKMIVITSRGGNYGEGPGKDFDQQEPYLRTVLGFVGLTDPIFIHAQPMDAAGPQVRDQKIAEAQAKARLTASAI